MDKGTEWIIALKVTDLGPDGDAKQTKIKFNNKHISVSTFKPLFPRKGENKPDIVQV